MFRHNGSYELQLFWRVPYDGSYDNVCFSWRLGTYYLGSYLHVEDSTILLNVESAVTLHLETLIDFVALADSRTKRQISLRSIIFTVCRGVLSVWPAGRFCSFDHAMAIAIL